MVRLSRLNGSSMSSVGHKILFSLRDSVVLFKNNAFWLEHLKYCHKDYSEDEQNDAEKL